MFLLKDVKGNLVENICRLQYHISNEEGRVDSVEVQKHGNSRFSNPRSLYPVKRSMLTAMKDSIKKKEAQGVYSFWAFFRVWPTAWKAADTQRRVEVKQFCCTRWRWRPFKVCLRQGRSHPSPLRLPWRSVGAWYKQYVLCPGKVHLIRRNFSSFQCWSNIPNGTTWGYSSCFQESFVEVKKDGRKPYFFKPNYDSPLEDLWYL